MPASPSWGARRRPAALGTGRAMAALPDGFVVAGEVPDGELAYRACLIRLDARAEVTGRGVFGPAGVTGFDAVTRGGGAPAGGGVAAAPHPQPPPPPGGGARLRGSAADGGGGGRLPPPHT